MPNARRPRPGPRPWVLLLLTCLVVLVGIAGVVAYHIGESIPPPLSAITPVEGAPGVVMQTVRFGDPFHRTTFDVYWRQDGQRRAAVFLIHGGAWFLGDKDSHRPQAIQLAQAGYVAATTDYRLAPVKWPAQIDDVKSAYDRFLGRADAYNFDPHRVAVAGESAGGQLAMLLGTDFGTPKVATVISLSGPSSITELFYQPSSAGCTTWPNCTLGAGPAGGWADILTGCNPLTCPNVYNAASPVVNVTDQTSPMLLVNSSNEIIDPAQAFSMSEALAAHGVANQVIIVPGSRHGEELLPVVQPDIVSWLQRWIGPPVPGPPAPPVGAAAARP